MMKRFWGLLIVISELAFAYGGFGTKALFVNFLGLKQRLNEYNYEWGGRDSFHLTQPLWWLEGQGQGGAGPVTFGGGGAVTFRSTKTDSLGAKIAGVAGSFKFGYPVRLTSFLEVQPNVDFGINSLLIFVHSRESGMSNFNRWFLTWGFNVLPAVTATGRFRSGVSSWAGIYVTGGYLIPLGSQNWYGSELPPEFSVRGWAIGAGLIFGRMAPKPFRI
jgi:hypothetical protein